MKKEKQKKQSLLQLWKLSSPKTLLQRKQCHSGWVRFSISILLLIVGCLNLIRQYQLSGNILDRPYLSFLLFIFSAMVYFLGTKVLISIILFILGIITLIDSPNISDLTASWFFVFAFHIIKNHKYALFIYLSNVPAITYKAMTKAMTIEQSFVLLIGLTSIYACYYLMIYRNIKPPHTKIKNLSDIENKLLSGLASGQSQKTTIADMGLSQSVGYDTVKKIKEKLNSESMDEIMFKLGRNQYSKNRKEK